MDIERVRGYFNDPFTVDHYVRAVANVGLWESEKRIFTDFLEKDDSILDLGCGAGRISLGLAGLGYTDVIGADLAEAMVEQASEIAEYLGRAVRFEVADATKLHYESGRFDGVIFGFNGLMQIPGAVVRQRALSEVYRILRPGGLFVFTTLDRDGPMYRKVFAEADNIEHDLRQNPNLIDYGDRHFATEHGTTFMHVPVQSEVRAALRKADLTVVETRMRSEIVLESRQVEAFSEDCRFWIARK